MNSLIARCAILSAAALAAWAPTASAELIVDAAGDLINGFNAATNPDLDVITAESIYDSSTNTFTFTSTLAGAVGTTPNMSFVWGVNRGGGTAGFAGNGLPNVLFDRVVRLVPGGQSQIAGGGLATINLDASAVTFSGNTITATFSADLLPGNGFTPSQYTVNLWPRVNSPAGFPGISDFAPNDRNAAVTVVPSPAAAAAFGLAGLLARRRR